MYCIKMKRSQDEFWNSTFSQIVTMIDMYTDELKLQNAVMNNEQYETKYFKEEPHTVSSLKQIEGLV